MATVMAMATIFAFAVTIAVAVAFVIAEVLIMETIQSTTPTPLLAMVTASKIIGVAMALSFLKSNT